MKKFLIIMHFLLLTPHLSFASRVSPVDNGKVTSGIGWRLDPFGSGRMVYHSGFDIAVPEGTPVHPTQDGIVYFAGLYKGYGNLVVVEHGQGYVTLYGHNSEVRVKRGDRVNTNTVIALAGSTGRSTGSHVHYEIRQLPGYGKARRDQMEKGIKTFMANNLDSLVDNFAQGKGGGEIEMLLPADAED